ncbi:MAG: methylated-DNA--[protein]-cysteine S-methyltransferase [Armatimonadota bacterium]
MEYYCVVETAAGYVALACCDGRLTRSTMPRPTPEEVLAEIAAGLDEGTVEDVGAFGELPNQLRLYFQGERVSFDSAQVDLSAYGPFHARVIRETRAIPYGTVVTYGELARAVGSPGAARAVGAAMAANRTPIIVPCHRVIASGGGIGGFSSGLDWKRKLLKIEGINI